MRGPVLLFIAAWAAALADAEHHVEPTRRLLRDMPADSCKNTMQGMLHITDSKGVLCQRDELDYRTGCCAKGKQHACDGCSLVDRCCTELEFCVSCCMAPMHDAEALSKITLRAPKHKEAGMWDDPFEYCRGVCRTHGSSTSHENAYISSRHHCFSKLGKPLLSDPLPAGALGGVHVALGEVNQGCDQVCQSQGGKRCSAHHLPLLNTCDQLREYTNCEAGCEKAAAGSGALPSYVDSKAVKASRPAMCFTAPDEKAITCEGKDSNNRRLCPCV